MTYLIRFTLVLIILLPFRVSAGWVITGRYIDRDGRTILKRYFIQNNEIKVERFNLIYSCNLKTESIIIVDPENLVFVKTTLKAYTEKIKGAKLSRLNELLKIIPEDQRKEYEKLYRAQVEQAVKLPLYPDDSLSITRQVDTVKLLGHRTTKFNISQNDLTREEFFFTNEVDISDEIDLNVFLRYVYLLEPEDKTVKYRASKKYSNIVGNGLVLRRFMFEDGYRTEWQVNKIEKKNIPAYEFGSPDLCKELNLDEWIARQQVTDDKYYDDYE